MNLLVYLIFVNVKTYGFALIAVEMPSVLLMAAVRNVQIVRFYSNLFSFI